MASHCPSGFINQVMRESTSYNWILDQVYSTFGLETKGENFLCGNDMKFEFGPGFTHNQAMMMMTDFYIISMLPKRKICKGKELTKDEEHSPQR